MKRTVQLLVLTTSLFAFTPRVDASCYLDCMERSGCFSGGMTTTPQLCGINNSHAMEMCNIQCRGQVDPSSFGAIAYSRSDKLWGFTYGQPDQATAEKLAVQYCVKQGGAKCLVAASFHDTCGAIAADGNVVAWGTDRTKYYAEERAVAECTRIGGKACEAQASICSLPR